MSKSAINVENVDLEKDKWRFTKKIKTKSKKIFLVEFDVIFKEILSKTKFDLKL